MLNKFDNERKMPVAFTFGGKTHLVDNILGRFTTRKGCPLNAFLVDVNGSEVFFLYFHLLELNPENVFHKG